MSKEGTMRDPDIDEIIECKPRWNRHAQARLRVWHDDKLAVLTEIDDNDGPSVTNAAEDFWTVAEKRIGINLLATDWTTLEHYKAGRTGTNLAAEVDVVTFKGRDRDGTLDDVVWRSGHVTGHHAQLAHQL